MTPRQRCLKIIAEARGHLFDQGDLAEFKGSAWTGLGLVWASSGDHSVAFHFYTDRPAGWRYLLSAISDGTEPCTTPDCDVCGDGYPFPCDDRSCLSCEEAKLPSKAPPL